MERLRSILPSWGFTERGPPTDIEFQHEGWELGSSTQSEPNYPHLAHTQVTNRTFNFQGLTRKKKKSNPTGRGTHNTQPC